MTPFKIIKLTAPSLDEATLLLDQALNDPGFEDKPVRFQSLTIQPEIYQRPLSQQPEVRVHIVVVLVLDLTSETNLILYEMRKLLEKIADGLAQFGGG